MTPYDAAKEAVPTTPVAQVPPHGQAAHEAVQEPSEAAVTDHPAPLIPGDKARVEYRDQDGNLLPEDLVNSLRAEGKVKFETRYEANTKLEHGHEVPVVDGKIVHPPHPDVEGQNPETSWKSDAPESPASVQGNEPSVERQGSQEAKPASEGNEATQQ